MKRRLALLVAGILVASPLCGCYATSPSTNVATSEAAQTTNTAQSLSLTGTVVANSGSEIVVQADSPESKRADDDSDTRNIQDFYILRCVEGTFDKAVDDEDKLIGFREVEVGKKIGFEWESDSDDYGNPAIAPSSIWYL